MKAEYMSHMGDDLFVANVARVSFAKEKEVFDQSDERIIKFLARENHWTPFGHPQISLRMQAPIPIRTQCFKHKIGFVENEESRRYISTSPELYIPDEFRAKPEGSIKQGSGEVHGSSRDWRVHYEAWATRMIAGYHHMIEDGICPEQARFILPQGCMVNWIWTGSLQAYSRFCKLRMDGHAQQEIQELAHTVSDIIEPLFPVSWKALMES